MSLLFPVSVRGRHRKALLARVSRQDTKVRKPCSNLQVFVHFYLKLIERGCFQEASAFLKTWSQDYVDLYNLELRSLTLIQRADQMEASGRQIQECVLAATVL